MLGYSIYITELNDPPEANGIKGGEIRGRGTADGRKQKQRKN